MGHIVNPRLFRLNYVVFWATALISKKKFSAYFDTKNLFIDDYIDRFFKRKKIIERYSLYLLYFKIIYNYNTLTLFFVFKQDKIFVKQKFKSNLIKKTTKNFLFFKKIYFLKKYFIKKKKMSLISNLCSLNFFLKKITNKKIRFKFIKKSFFFNKILMKSLINKDSDIVKFSLFKFKNFVKKKNVKKKKYINKHIKGFIFLQKISFFSKILNFNINNFNLLCFKKSIGNSKFLLLKKKKKKYIYKYKGNYFISKKAIRYKVFCYNQFFLRIKKNKFFIKNKKLFFILKKKNMRSFKKKIRRRLKWSSIKKKLRTSDRKYYFRNKISHFQRHIKMGIKVYTWKNFKLKKFKKKYKFKVWQNRIKKLKFLVVSNSVKRKYRNFVITKSILKKNIYKKKLFGKNILKKISSTIFKKKSRIYLLKNLYRIMLKIRARSKRFKFKKIFNAKKKKVYFYKYLKYALERNKKALKGRLFVRLQKKKKQLAYIALLRKKELNFYAYRKNLKLRLKNKKEFFKIKKPFFKLKKFKQKKFKVIIKNTKKQKLNLKKIVKIESLVQKKEILKNFKKFYALKLTKNLLRKFNVLLRFKTGFRSKIKNKKKISSKKKSLLHKQKNFEVEEKYIKKFSEKKYTINKKFMNVVPKKYKKYLFTKTKKKILLQKFISKIFLFEHYFKILTFKKKFLKAFILLFPKMDLNIVFVIKNYWSFWITSDLLAELIILKLLQRHVIWAIMRSTIKFLKKQIKKKSIYGYAILIMGRFSRKDRATFKWYKRGPFTKSNRIIYIDYASRKVYLKFSTCSFKINLIKTIGYKKKI